MTTVGGRDCVLGVDIAVYQPAVDWRAVAAARQFAVIKASGGDGGLYVDGQFAAHRSGSAGLLPRAAYHFLGDGQGDAQADLFVRTTGGYAGFELPPVVDVETYNSGRSRPSLATVRDFIAELHRSIDRRWTGPTGQPVALVIYTGAPMASSLGPEMAIYDLWLAAYLNPYYGNPWNGVTNTASPNVAALGLPDRYIPRPWTSWSAWQFAGGDGGSPGVGNGGTGCDQNVMTVDAFHRLTGGSTTTEGGLTMADAQAILDELAELRKQLGGDANDSRALEGLNPLKLPDADDQYVVVWSDAHGGWAKRHLTGAPEVGVLTKQGTLQKAPSSIDPAKGLVNFVTLDGAEADWLRALPEV